MPTRKHRVTVTLEPRTGEVIKRMADLQGRSQASVISELIEEVAEPMQRTLALLEAASAAPEQVRHGLRASAEMIEAQLRESVASFGGESTDLHEFLHRVQNGADDDAQKAGGSARRRPARKSSSKGQPPGSNHGGQVSKKGGSNG